MNLAITLGDPDGLGPELFAKIIKNKSKLNQIKSKLIVFGSLKFLTDFDVDAEVISQDFILKRTQNKNRIFFVPSDSKKIFQSRDQECGYHSGASIQNATEWVLKKKAVALVTGPINKKRLNLAGFRFPGHTQMLAHICSKGSKKYSPIMMLANSYFRVALVTDHLPISSVSENISKKLIFNTLTTVSNELKLKFGIKNPKIAICALNPHAGESGLLGKEEQNIIEPAINLFNRSSKGAAAQGPFPADTFFALEYTDRRFDAIVCQYHDQGLIPAKMVDFKNTINITLGLPIIRTSVDHGTGFDIVGKGIADESSFYEAIIQAEKMGKLLIRNN